jgi:uncharacterized protein (DUF924 family)
MRRSVELISALGDPELRRSRTDKIRAGPKDIIDRFGRFPHRNAILGPRIDRGGN